MLAGTGDEVAAVYRATNVEASPIKYGLSPQELLSILRDVEKRGWEVVGFYHSHTHTEAFPSATDKKLAFWPDCRYVIVSLQNAESPSVRAFCIVNGEVTEDTIAVDR